MDIKNLTSLFKALGDENRLRLINLLKRGELCCCQINQEMQLPQNLISHHLKVLRESGVLNSRKDGRWVHYSLNDHFADKFKSII